MPLLQHNVSPFLFSALNFPIQIMCQGLQALYIIAGEISTGLFLTCLFPISFLPYINLILPEPRKPFPHFRLLSSCPPANALTLLSHHECNSLAGTILSYSINPAPQYLMWEGIYLRGFNNWSMSSLKFCTYGIMLIRYFHVNLKSSNLFYTVPSEPKALWVHHGPKSAWLSGQQQPLSTFILVIPDLGKKKRWLTQWQIVLVFLIRFSGENCTWRVRASEGRHSVTELITSVSVQRHVWIWMLLVCLLFCKIRAQENRWLSESGRTSCSLWKLKPVHQPKVGFS